jgi:hypothetical protein
MEKSYQKLSKNVTSFPLTKEGKRVFNCPESDGESIIKEYEDT